MAENEKKPTTEELLDRITRLEARCEKQVNDTERVAKAAREYCGTLRDHCNTLERELRDAFERIKNLELKLFPNLARDMAALYKITGEHPDNPVNNPLDRRSK